MYLKLPQTDRLGTQQVLSLITTKVMPYTVSRVVFAVNTMLVGWVLAQMDDKDAVASGPMLASLRYLFVGAPKGLLLSTGLLIGDKNGAAAYEEVGKIYCSGTKMALLASVISVAGLLGSSPIMSRLGLLETGVSKIIFVYLLYQVWGIPANLMTTVDKQLGVAAKDGKVPTGFTGLYTLIELGLGLSLVFKLIKSNINDINAFGLSETIGFWVCLAILKSYYFFSQRYQKFKLFNKEVLSSFSDDYSRSIRVLGISSAAQSIAEFSSIIGLSFLFSAYDTTTKENILAVTAPTFQLLSVWGLICLAYGQAIGTQVSYERGKMKVAFESAGRERVAVGKLNLIKIHQVCLIVASVISLIVAAICFAKPNYFTDPFVADSMSRSDKHSAARLVSMTSASVLLELVNSTFIGLLKGFEDLNFAALSKFIFIAVMPLMVGLIMVATNKVSVEGILWARTAGQVISMCAVAHRWYRYIGFTSEQLAEKKLVLPFFSQMEESTQVAASPSHMSEII